MDLPKVDATSVRELEEEAIRSSQLAGAGMTRQEAEILLRTQRQPRNADERMVYNNYQALLQTKAIANRPLTVDALHELHQIVTEGAQPLDASPLRDDAQYPVYVADTDGTVLYVPPKSIELPERLATLIAFANAENVAMHPAIKAIILHFALAHDHPYLDGNGRTARALFYWAMLQAGYRTVEYLSISSVLRVHKARYLRSFLYTEQDEGDLTYFVLAQLEVILEAYEKLTDAMAYKRQQLATWDAPDLNARQKALMADVFARANTSVTILDHQHTHGVSYPTARDDLLGLVEKGYLTQVKVGKKFVFLQKG